MTEIYSQKLEALKEQGYRLLKPEWVSSLEDNKLWQLADAWAKNLDDLGGDNTFHPEPVLLAKLMREQHSCILVNTRGDFVSGAKIQPWGYNEQNPQQKIDEITNVSLTNPEYTAIATELGGMVTIENVRGQGCAGIVAETMAKHALSLYVGPHVSVVRPNNIASAKIFNKLGWELINEASIMPMLGFDLLAGGWEGSLVFCNPQSINK